jgi:hypothetical protein
MGAHLLKDLPCKNSGKPFRARPYDYNRGFKTYCGKICYDATRPRVRIPRAVDQRSEVVAITIPK